MPKWTEVAFAAMAVGIIVSLTGHVEGLVIFTGGLLMYLGGDPT